MATKSEPKLDMSIFYKAAGCPLSKVQLDNPDHQQLLDSAIADVARVPHQAIRDVLLEQWGIGVSRDTIANHRSTPQKCSCRNIPK
jgi:hypothetical protein